jgi:hypothetical protein
VVALAAAERAKQLMLANRLVPHQVLQIKVLQEEMAEHLQSRPQAVEVEVEVLVLLVQTLLALRAEMAEQDICLQYLEHH